MPNGDTLEPKLGCRHLKTLRLLHLHMVGSRVPVRRGCWQRASLPVSKGRGPFPLTVILPGILSLSLVQSPQWQINEPLGPVLYLVVYKEMQLNFTMEKESLV